MLLFFNEDSRRLAPPSGGKVRVQVVSPPVLFLNLARAPVPWVSRLNGIPGLDSDYHSRVEFLSTFLSWSTHRYLQVATRYSLQRGFPRIRVASAGCPDQGVIDSHNN